MSAFGKYFGRLLKVIWEDIIEFFKSIIDFIVSIFRFIVSNFSYYKSVFDLYAQDFNFVGWIFFVLSIILILGLITLLVFLIVKLTKRRYIAKRKVKDKIVLLREIENLNHKVIDLMDERSQLLSLKVAELGYAPTKQELVSIGNARKVAESETTGGVNAEEKQNKSKSRGYKFKTDKKGRPVFGKNGYPEVEPEYKTDENGNHILDENGKPIPMVDFERDEKGNVKFDANGFPIIKPLENEKNEENTENTDEDDGKERLPKEVLEKARFPKLITIDFDYRNYKFPEMSEEESTMTLEQLIKRFRNFAAGKLKLFYSYRTLALFFAGMGTTHFAILEGISGTGKTSLPYAFGKFFKSRSPIVAVQPSWKDRSELIGYLNEFTKKFNESAFLEELYTCAKHKEPMILVLDEMNLARIEYYFADFLSIMEMPNRDEWIIEIINTNMDGDPILLDHGKFMIPKNVWFLGTANNDDSTFLITDKVYDRAMSMSLNKKTVAFEPEFDADSITMTSEYFEKLFDDACTKYSISEETLQKLANVDKYMITNFKISFGNRIMKQIKRFVPCYMGCGGTEYEAVDHLLTRKILHKLEALNISFIKNELKGLLTVLDKEFGKGVFEDSIEYINELLKQV